MPSVRYCRLDRRHSILLASAWRFGPGIQIKGEVRRLHKSRAALVHYPSIHHPTGLSSTFLLFLLIFFTASRNLFLGNGFRH